MAPNYQGRRLIDSDGNIYVFNCPLDVNANHVEDILLSTKEGITKLVGYKLAIDGLYKDMEDQVMQVQSTYNFYKKIDVFSEGQNVSQEGFGKTMKELIAKAKESKINSARFTSWKGESVYSDGRGYFLKRTIDCGVPECDHKIEGTIRLSLNNDGDISRGQNFTPLDKRVQKARAGSKKWLCPTCAVKSITPEEPKEVMQESAEVEVPVSVPTPVEPTKAPKNKKEKLLKKLAELSDSSCEVSADYLKGYLNASLEILKE